MHYTNAIKKHGRIELINTEGMFDNNKLTAISNLLLSYHSGYHLLLGKRSLFKRIKESSDFGTVERSIASINYQDQTFIQSIKEDIELYVQVDFETTSSPINISLNGKSIIKFSYLYFLKQNSSAPALLLTENTSDFKLFKKILDVYLKRNNLKQQISFCNELAGGSYAKTRFDELKNENRICLCLLDNDKKHPKDSNGDTINAFSSYDFNLSKTIKAFDIGVHELESLLPMLNLEETIKNYESKHINAFDYLKEIMEKSPESKYYFDHKEGFSVNKIYELDKKGDYWVPLLRKYNVNNHCFNKGKCSCTRNCMAIVGFGDKIFNMTIDGVLKMTHIKLYEILNELEIKWENIGKELVNWGCGPVKQRIS